MADTAETRGTSHTEQKTLRRVEVALDELEQYHESVSGDETPPLAATIAELLRLFGHDRQTVTLESRLRTLRGDAPDERRQRENVIARLETLIEYREKRAAGWRRYTDDPAGEDPVKQAAETLADALRTTEEVDA